ncbi:MAG: TlpA family protein disulfide reductase [Prevotella sp.]|jgi:thiol-disulfide isomerase/thioredoxin|nr:TlpA family protein disulfide reductase [Prevotella sp.]MCI1281999.1 TlpA family protein disulfide reductase [Prevotella sp.]
MRSKSLLLLVIISCIVNFGQIKAQGTDSIHVDCTLNDKGAQVKTAQLMKYTSLGDMEALKGTVSADGKHIHFSVPSDIQPGVYYVKTDGYYLNQQVIITGHESEIALDYSQVREDNTPNAHFITSEQNKAYCDYTYYSNQLLQQCNTLFNMERQIILQSAKEHLKNAEDILMAEYNRLNKDFCSKYDGTPAGILVANDPHRAEYNNMVDKPVSPEIQATYWNGIDTANPFLQNSNLYYGHIYTYLMYYFVQSQKAMKTKTEYNLQKMLETATDTIMERFRKDETIRTNMMTYLETLYMNLGQMNMLKFVHENYIQCEQCTDEIPSTEAGKQLQKQIEGMKFCAPGLPAYDIKRTDKYGKVKGLKDLAGDKVLVIFWNTSCSHCIEQMPEVEKYIESQGDKKTTTIAVCITEDVKEYNEMIKKYPAMIHVRDTGGWNGKLAESYYLFGTPTFFLLDKNRNFIGTYYSWDSIKGKLQ